MSFLDSKNIGGKVVDIWWIYRGYLVGGLGYGKGIITSCYYPFIYNYQ